MLNLNTNVSLVHKLTHGYFIASKYLSGKLQREVVLTIYDSVIGQSASAYMFLSDSKVVLVISSNLGDLPSSLYEIEKSDKFEIIEQADLKKVLNSPESEQNLLIKTSHPISWIRLNSRFLLLTDIKADALYGTYRWNMLTFVWVGAKYREEQKNLLTMISAILNEKPFPSIKPVSGMSGTLAKINIYGMILILLAFASFIVFAILNK